MKSYKRIVFWFRQDLRTNDNIGLWNAIEDSIEVLPIFLFDTNILKSLPPKDKRLGFLVAAIDELEKDLKNIGGYLHIKYGNPEEIFSKLLKKYGFEAVYANRSYGPYGKKRDMLIADLCNRLGIKFKLFDDFLLVEPDKLKPYKVFTPYFNQRKQQIKADVLQDIKRINCPKIYIKPKIQSIKYLDFLPNEHRNVGYGKKRLDRFDFSNYDKLRDFPAIEGNSRLSPYIKHGILSIRQVCKKAFESESLGGNVFISELAWRDFWQQIFHYFPETYFLEFQLKRRNIRWQNDEKKFEARKSGLTGYPIVDAGMRQLREENFMHNRARMIAASFLTKHLHIDRRRGEKYFREQLIDIDSNVNLGNWQWAASVGADPKPLRIFNPMLQAKKFDPQCEYIKKYIPELASVPNEHILDPYRFTLKYAPKIVDHFDAVKTTKNMYFGSV